MAANDPDVMAVAISGLAGLLGRLMFVAQEQRNPFNIQLLWQIPIALGMGWVGRGLGEHLGLQGFPLFAVSIVLAYLGPGTFSWLVQRFLARSP